MAATVVSVCFVINVYSPCICLEGEGGDYVRVFVHMFTVMSVCFVGLYTVLVRKLLYRFSGGLETTVIQLLLMTSEMCITYGP